MRPTLKTMTLAGFLAIGGLLAMGTPTAQAHEPQGYGGRGYGGGGYGGGGGYYGGGGYGGGGGYYGGGGYGGGYGVPSYNYYGNGGHDFQPHMHTVQTPYGGYQYYGNGAHDFAPHGHTQTPYGITGYNGGYYSNTTSYSSPYPTIYRPW